MDDVRDATTRLTIVSRDHGPETVKAIVGHAKLDMLRFSMMPTLTVRPALLRRSGDPFRITTMSESIAPIKTWFNGLQPRWLSGNRLFRIYVSDRMLAGAYIAGQIHDQQSGNIQLQQAAFFLRAWVRRRVEQRHEREDSYDARDPFGPSFLGHDTRNFQILRSDISGSCFKRNRSLWTPYNVGSVELSFLDGSTRRFIIVGDQDPGAVLDLLTRFDPTIEVTGKSNPLPKPSPSRTRLSYMMLGVSLLLTGMLFGATAVAGVAPLAAHAPLAGINLLAGAWCLVRALRIPNDSSKDGQD